MKEYKFEIGDMVRLKKGKTIHIVVKREIWGDSNKPAYLIRSTVGKGKTQWISENLICKPEEIQITLSMIN